MGTLDMDTDWLAATETEEKSNFYFNILNELSATYGKDKKRRIVITAGNMGHSDGSDRDEKGLISYHAYSVLQIKELVNKSGDKVRLVKVRNPHGLESSEWQGKLGRPFCFFWLIHNHFFGIVGEGWNFLEV